MKRAGFLFEQVADFHGLCGAARRVLRGRRSLPGYARLAYEIEGEVLALQRELVAGTYRPRPYRTFMIADPKPRTISAADLRDRVVHHALCASLEPVFEQVAVFDSYACRPGKGTHKAVARAGEFARRYRYFLKLDIRHCFETIDHEILKRLMRRVIKDRRVLWLVDLLIDHGAPGSSSGKGLPIGNLTSQHFANFYLTRLDHFVKEFLRVPGYVRYMDDELLFGDSKADLWRWYEAVRSFVADRLRLELKDEVMVLAPVTEGIPFLGLRVWPRWVRLNRCSRQRFLRGVRRLERSVEDGGMSDQAFERSMASRVGHLTIADTVGLRRSVFFTEPGGPEGRRVRTG